MFIKASMCLFLFGVVATLASGQETEYNDRDTTLIVVNGTIVNIANKQPVAASIKYESLPFGNRVGIFTGDAFTVTMDNQHDYSLSILAHGYIPYKETLKTEGMGPDTQIDKVIELIPENTNHLIRLEKLIFALGKADISRQSNQELDELAQMLKKNPSMSIQLEGHTDFRGNTRQNMKLSEKRVDAVKDYLIKEGIDKKRIKTKAFGGTQPISREDDEASRRSNRRVEVRILSN